MTNQGSAPSTTSRLQKTGGDSRRSSVRIAVTGASGMLGRKLVERMVLDHGLAGSTIAHALLVDIENTEDLAAGLGAESIVGDISSEDVARTLVAEQPDIIFHLAAVVSGEAEADFEKGYRVNVDATRQLFDEIRAIDGYRPRVVYSSSLAAFGPPLPDVIGDEHRTTPLTSYGTQKVIGELLLSEYTRRGYLDGIGLRLPTICVRPGTPNRAASSFFSSIIREPLNGATAILPVSDEVRHWFASPRAAVGFLIRAAILSTEAVGDVRCLNMPGVSATVAEQIAALRKIAGDDAVHRIVRQPNGEIERIVANWPQSFEPTQALALGFRGEASFEEIIRVYIEDELDGHTR